MLPNSTQVQTASSSLMALAAGYAASQHWLGLSETQWLTLFGAAVVAWPAIVTRAKSLKNQVASMKGTTVVTDAASASATANPDVIAATPAVVQAINAAKAAQ